MVGVLERMVITATMHTNDAYNSTLYVFMLSVLNLYTSLNLINHWTLWLSNFLQTRFEDSLRKKTQKLWLFPLFSTLGQIDPGFIQRVYDRFFRWKHFQLNWCRISVTLKKLLWVKLTQWVQKWLIEAKFIPLVIEYEKMFFFSNNWKRRRFKRAIPS